MRAVEQFLANPPAFLRRNHVTFVGIMPPASGAYRFILLAVDAPARRRGAVFLGMSIGKADAGVYQIRYADARNQDPQRLSDGELFDATWSGFAAGGKAEARLDGAGPGIMLTPELTGCTVAFAAQRDGSARFSHYNIKDGAQTLAAADIVGIARRDYRTAGDVGIYTKEHYRSRGTYEMPGGQRSRPAANVVGWRTDGRWTFWMQYTDLKGEKRQILSVRQLVPGVHFG